MAEDKIKYEYEKHSPTTVKFMPWLMCRYCGLVYLNNRITKWCIKMGCNNEYHPGYKSALKNLSGPENVK